MSSITRLFVCEWVLSALRELYGKLGTEKVTEHLKVLAHNSLPSALFIQRDDTFYVATFFHGESISDTYITKPANDTPVSSSTL